MAHIICENCLKTYRPYRYGVALYRALMYEFSDWWEFEDERVIEEQFREHQRDPYVRKRLIKKIDTHIMDDSFVKDFNFYYQYLENKRRITVSATFLCFDCEKYYCANCVRKHSGHFTFSKDDKYNYSEWGRISVKMLDKIKAEGDIKLENIRREKTYILCDVVDVKCKHGQLELLYVLHDILERRYDADKHYGFFNQELYFPDKYGIESLHVLNNNKKWLVADDKNSCIKIFNVNDNKMTRRIKLSSWPLCITEVPSTDPSQCLIAVSFPFYKSIDIINIHSTPAQVVSCIKVQRRVRDLDYCNNKLITRFEDYLDSEWHHSIHVMDISGVIINIVDLRHFPSMSLEYFGTGCMSVYSESETIYICHRKRPPCVIGLSLNGHVLHSVTFPDIEPALIHVDKDQNVYVMSNHLPIYKLSADLKHRVKIVDIHVGSNPYIKAMRFHNDKFYLASDKGIVYIIQCD